MAEQLIPGFHLAADCPCPPDTIHATWHVEYHTDGTSHENPGYAFRKCIVCGHYFVIAQNYHLADGLYCGLQDEKHPAFKYESRPS